MKELMTSSRSSEITTLALLLVLALAAVAPAAAVSVDEADTDVPGEAEAGTQVSATIVLNELYREPKWDPWTLQAETDLTNVTWTVTYIDQTGNEFDTGSHDGRQLNGGNGVEIRTADDVDQVRIELVGEVPAPGTYTYPEEETFVVASLTQTRGEEGSFNEIRTWEAHHYTTADEQGNPGSKEARQAIDDAGQAIDEAKADGADVTQANQSLGNAVEFYESGDFSNAVKNARTAKQEANEAKQNVKSSRQTTQLLMYAGIAVLVVALLGGGYWYYQQQQDDYDKLG
jgi:hypothetical protein